MLYFFFYFPLGLDVPRTRPAWMTSSLAGLAVLGFVVARVDAAWFWAHYDRLVYVPLAPSLSALVASAFMHGDWLHLLANLLALGVFAPALEARLGAWRLLVLFLLCHLAGSLVQGAVALLFLPPPAAGHGILGASGAIAGLVGVFLVRMHFARLRVAYWAFLPLQAYTRAGTRTLPVLVAVVLWILMQLGLALAQSQGGDPGIAVGAHLGGLAAGVAVGKLLGLQREAMAEAHLHRGRRYLESARWYPAQGEFLAYVRCCPEDAEGHLELARTYRLTHRRGDADAHYARACECLAAARQLDRVEEVHGEAVRGNQDFTLAPHLQLQLGRLLERCYKGEAAQQIYLRYARRYPESSAAPLALFRAARLVQQHYGKERARPLYVDLIIGHPGAPEAELARLALHA